MNDDRMPTVNNIIAIAISPSLEAGIYVCV